MLETKFREEADKEDEEAGADGVAEGKGKEAAIANGEDGNKDASEDDEWEPSTKITRLMELLEETQRTAPQEKTIVFCSFTRMLDMVEPALKKAGIYFKRVGGVV